MLHWCKLYYRHRKSARFYCVLGLLKTDVYRVNSKAFVTQNRTQPLRRIFLNSRLRENTILNLWHQNSFKPQTPPLAQNNSMTTPSNLSYYLLHVFSFPNLPNLLHLAFNIFFLELRKVPRRREDFKKKSLYFYSVKRWKKTQSSSYIPSEEEIYKCLKHSAVLTMSMWTFGSGKRRIYCRNLYEQRLRVQLMENPNAIPM